MLAKETVFIGGLNLRKKNILPQVLCESLDVENRHVWRNESGHDLPAPSGA